MTMDAARKARIEKTLLDRRDLFWSRFWSRVVDVNGNRLNPAAAELRTTQPASTWDLPDQDCQMWEWEGARRGNGNEGLPYRIQGLVILYGHTLYAHRLAWMFYNKRLVPDHMNVVHTDACRMFVRGVEKTNLCMWPPCWELRPGHGYVPIDEAYSELCTDEDMRGQYRNFQLVGGVWTLYDYTKEPRFQLI